MRNILDFLIMLWGLVCFLCFLAGPLILVAMVAMFLLGIGK